MAGRLSGCCRRSFRGRCDNRRRFRPDNASGGRGFGNLRRRRHRRRRRLGHGFDRWNSNSRWRRRCHSGGFGGLWFGNSFRTYSSHSCLDLKLLQRGILRAGGTSNPPPALAWTLEAAKSSMSGTVAKPPRAARAYVVVNTARESCSEIAPTLACGGAGVKQGLRGNGRSGAISCPFTPDHRGWNPGLFAPWVSPVNKGRSPPSGEAQIGACSTLRPALLDR